MPEVLHLGVVFQLSRRFNVLDAILCDALSKLVENHGVDALALVLLNDGNQKQIDSVVVLQGF